MLCGRAPRPPSTVRVVVDGRTHEFEGLYADDSLAQVRQRVEALVPGVRRGRHRLLDSVGNDLPFALALLGDRKEIQLARVEEHGDGDGDEHLEDEGGRQREIAALLQRARALPRPHEKGLSACRYLSWTQAVRAPDGKTAMRPLETMFTRLDAVGAIVVARLVTWRGGEASVQVKHDPKRQSVDALRGFQADVDAGDQLELMLAMPVGALARMLVAPTGAYRLIATATTYNAAGDDALQALTAAAAAVARRLGLRPPNAEADLEAATLEAELRSEGRPPDASTLKATVDASFYPLFAADTRRSATVLRYKRVADFDSGPRIREWMAERAGQAQLGVRSAMAAELRRTFLSLDAREAAALAAEPPPPAKRRARRRKGVAAPGAEVEVVLTPARDFFGYRLLAHVQSLEQWRQLQADVAAVVAAAGGSGQRPDQRQGQLTSFDLSEPPQNKDKVANVANAADAVKAPLEEGETLKRGDIVKRLYEADRELFQLRGKEDIYARHCGLHEMRQPVVIRGRDKASAAAVPSVAYGSTPERAAENAYACPAIWCPQSAVALKPKPHPLFGPDGQRKAVSPDKAAAIERAYQAQYVCPNAKAGGERPLFLYDSTYWNHNPAQQRHLGFHSTRKSAAGLCLPCCFKLPKDRVVRECAGDQGRGDAEADGDDDGNDKYVLGDAVVPIKAGRYGALPRAFRALLPPGGYVAKGFAPRGRHLLRAGLPSHRPSSLMAAVAALTGLPSAAAFVEDVAQRLTPTELVQLENGQLLLRLLASAGPTTEADAKAVQSRSARAWLGFDDAVAQPSASTVQRHLSMWRGFQSFLAYLRGPAVDERLLYDLVSRLHGFALGLLEADGDRVWFDCPTFVGYDMRPKEVRFGLLLKQRGTYEPLVLADVNRTSVAAKYVVPQSDPVVSRLLGRLVTSCQLEGVATPAAAAAAANGPVEAVVMRRDMLVVGVLSSDGLFVPFEPPLPSGHLGRLMAAHPESRLAHLEDLHDDGLRGPRDLVAALRKAAPDSRPTRRGKDVTAYSGTWTFESMPGGRYRPVTTLPVGPNFYSVPAEDDRTRWVAASKRAEKDYQAWKLHLAARPGTPLKKLAAAAPPGKTYWAARLAYELSSGRDVGPATDSSVRLGNDTAVSQRDLETLRFSRTPVL